jgi:anti-anti-sigma factor
MAGALYSVPESRRSQLLPTPFRCTCSGHGTGSAWVEASGELDLVAVPELEDALRVAAGAAPLVVLDLSELEFIDVAGVHAIVDASLRMLLGRRRLIVGFAPAHIAAAFVRTGQSDAVEILDLLEGSRPQPAPLTLVGSSPLAD